MLSIIIGFVLSFVVRWLAKIPFVKSNPKVVVGILAAIASVVAVVCLHCATLLDAIKQLQDQLGSLAVGVVTAYSVGVATHETITKPIAGPMNANSSLPVGVKPTATSPLQGGGALLILLILATAPMLTGCRPSVAGASIEGPRLTIVAIGDTLKLRTTWSSLGTFDSVIVSYSSTRFPTIRKAWPSTRQADSSLAIPAPALNPGDVVTVTANFSVKVGNASTPSGSLQASYTQPGVLPGTLTVVGLDIRPKSATVVAGQSIQFCVFARMSDGSIERTSASLGPECDGWWASYQTEARS